MDRAEQLWSQLLTPLPKDRMVDALASEDPFERAAYRTRQSARPEGGRREGALSAALSDPATVFNASPFGVARDALTAGAEGDYGRAALTAAPLALPLVGPVVRGAGALIRTGLRGGMHLAKAGNNTMASQLQEAMTMPRIKGQGVPRILEQSSTPSPAVNRNLTRAEMEAAENSTRMYGDNLPAISVRSRGPDAANVNSWSDLALTNQKTDAARAAIQDALRYAPQSEAKKPGMIDALLSIFGRKPE